MERPVKFKYPSMKRLKRLAISNARSVLAKPRESGNVLMLHTGRSGSTLLGDLLDQHRDVFWDGEVTERQFQEQALLRQTSVGEQFGAFNLEGGIERIRSRQRRLSAGRIYGVEIQHYQLEMLGSDLESYLAALPDLGIDRFILLERRNNLRKIVSHVVATSAERHHVKPGEKVSMPKARIDPQSLFVDHRFHKLRERLDVYDNFSETARKLIGGDRLLHLDYDDHIAEDPLNAYRMCCEFLGIAPDSPQVKFAKTANFPLEEMLENYDEVADFLTGTRYEWMAPARQFAKVAHAPESPI